MWIRPQIRMLSIEMKRAEKFFWSPSSWMDFSKGQHLKIALGIIMWIAFGLITTWVHLRSPWMLHNE